MALENYFIKQIDYKTAMAVIVERHYLHRKAPCSIAFGLFHGIGGVCNGIAKQTKGFIFSRVENAIA